MWEILNNASVAAFFGAFFAFLLVVISNWLRRRHLKSILTALISDNLDHTRHKRDSVRSNIEFVKEEGRITDAPHMRFPVGHIRDHQIQVLDLLSAAQNQSLHTLLFWMESIDDLLASAKTKATDLKALIRSGASEQEQSNVCEQYLELMEDVDRNLGLLCQLCEYYVDGHPEKIIDFRHPLAPSG